MRDRRGFLSIEVVHERAKGWNRLSFHSGQERNLTRDVIGLSRYQHMASHRPVRLKGLFDIMHKHDGPGLMHGF